MSLISVTIGDLIEDLSGMTGTVTDTPEMLNIRREFKPDGELLKVCRCDVSSYAGLHGILFILDRCRLVRAAGVEPA